jgi:hypothetical protein
LRKEERSTKPMLPLAQRCLFQPQAGDLKSNDSKILIQWRTPNYEPLTMKQLPEVSNQNQEGAACLLGEGMEQQPNAVPGTQVPVSA